jgi:class 3 adenylate cyclase
MDFDFSSLGLTEIIQLQDTLSQELKRRFERNLVLVFTDVVGSTEYFARFGDEAGRGLQQRHLDLLREVLPKGDGRIVDTAGDGAFTVFPIVQSAIVALVQLQELITNQNVSRAREHQLSIRTGVHWGPVLTDGNVVTGDSVNLSARIASTGVGGEIRLSRGAFLELPNQDRVRCRHLPPVELKGIPRPVEIKLFEWRDRTLYPALVRIEETGEQFPLPNLDTISFGRLKLRDGVQANDIVLSLPDKQMAQKISRWHFELRRAPDGFSLRGVSEQATEVNGKLVPRGDEVPIRPGTVVRLAGVMTLTFLQDPSLQNRAGEDTILNDTTPIGEV